nr:zinc finger, CCHC-type [Tanacetum cinerariifolium]
YLTLWTRSFDFGGRDGHTKFKGNQRKVLLVMMMMSIEALLDWIMDSGGSYHMTPRLDLFSDFMECDGARYIPELKRNLISLGTLEKERCTVKLQSGKIKVINGSRVVLSGTRRDNCVYSLDGHAVAGELNASVEEKDSLAQVWHKRLGHISEAGLQVLEKQGLFGKKSLVAGTPQQNGLAERMNRILMDKVRCLLIQSGLPKTFWAEATCTAAYLINKSPSTAIEKKTPMEMWSGHPSDYGMLRKVFH